VGAAAGRLERGRAARPRAGEHDVAFVPGYPFFAGPPDAAALRLSFTAHGPDEIAEGLRRLRRAWA
jgi:2-aminoadipate transaminase